MLKKCTLRRGKSWAGAAVAGAAFLLASLPLLAQQAQSCAESGSAQLSVDSGSPWRPPFGVDRVGAPLVVHLKVAAEAAEGAQLHEYYVAAYREGREIERQSLSPQPQPPSQYTARADSPPALFANVQLKTQPAEVALFARCGRDAAFREVTRQPVVVAEIEAQATARPQQQINPVDLGAVLVPHDWLLLAADQAAIIQVAAISRTRSVPNARVRAWFEGGKAVEFDLALQQNERATREIKLPFPSGGERNVLHVAIADGERELWKKDIRTMSAPRRPRWPAFGAVETKLRYDAPIVVRDSKSGVVSSLAYDAAWNPSLNDVVVFLPNGSRFVFWRGSNYIPFWAGRYNTGFCYQWAENLSQPVRHADGTVDYPEPLYDTELRYGHVRIMESTPSRVHIRWTYQSTDVQYNVWGDHTTEDFYFYPDGFGTRSVTLTSTPDALYQLSEFIILTPQAAFPLEVLPSHMADVLFLDGERKRITVPLQRDAQTAPSRLLTLADSPRKVPAIYRIFDHKDDPSAAIYFHPRDSKRTYGMDAMHDGGEIVTPIYWGSHWPLSRGKITGWGVDDRIYSNPAHNSFGGWLPALASLPGFDNPEPISTDRFQMLDTLGRSRDLMIRRWSWLIAKTDTPEQALVEWAHSFQDPPSLEVTGARLDFPSYSPERRALRLTAQSPSITIKLKPVAHSVNPVFEIDAAPGRLISVTVDGAALPAQAYAWDGKTLWTKAVIGTGGSTIGLQFR